MIKLFRVSIPSSVLVLLFGDIFLLVLCYVLPAMWVEDLPLDLYLLEGNGANVGLVIAILVAGLYLSDFYDNFRKHPTMLMVQQLCVIQGVELLIQSLLSYVRSPLVTSRWLMLYGCAGVVVVLPLWRRMFSSIVARRFGAAKVLWVGSSPLVREIVQELTERPELGLKAIGYLDDERDPEAEALGLRYKGSLAELPKIADAEKPERIIVDVQAGYHSRFPVESLLDQQFVGRSIERSSTTYETISAAYQYKACAPRT